MREEPDRYTFSVWRLAGNAGVAVMIGIFGSMIPQLNSLLNWRLLLFMVGLPFFLLLAIYQTRFLKFIPHSLATLFAEPSNPKAINAAICCSGIRYTVGAGIVTAVGYVIYFLMHLNDPHLINQGIAVGLLPILYGIVCAGAFSYVYDACTDDEPKTEGSAITLLKNLALGLVVVVLMIALFYINSMVTHSHVFE